MNDFIMEVIGAVGAIEVIIAYGLNSYQKIRSNSRGFYLLNLTGAALLIFYSIYKEAWANMFINAIWVVIAGIAIGRVFINKSKKKS